MKKFIYIIALLFLLVACNEELQIDTKQPTIGNKTRAFTSQTFSFDSVTKTRNMENIPNIGRNAVCMPDSR